MNPMNRRSAVQLMAAGLLAKTAPMRADTAPQTLPSSFRSLAEAFEAPRSETFGVTAAGKGLDSESYYAPDTPAESDLSFDVSNNRILCSLSGTGEMRRACLASGVVPLAGSAVKGGVYTSKELIRCGPWSVEFRQGDSVIPLHSAGRTAVALPGGVFPLFSTQLAGLRIERIVLAPVASGSGYVPPAILMLVRLHNEGRTEVSGSLASSGVSADGGAFQATIRWNGVSWAMNELVALRLAPGGQQVVALAFVLAGTAAERDECAQRLQARSPLDWWNDTWRVRTQLYGQLAIPEAPYFAEGVTRFAETCRQSALRGPAGEVVGGFLGSDVDTRTINWTRDFFYSMLAMSMFEPRLSADSILYLLEWSLPAKPSGRGLARFPDAGRVTQSLGNAVSPLALAAAYYRTTGDTAFFLKHPEILRTGRQLLSEVLASRRGQPFLFPSMYVSDGDARGDYHTGSNVLAWYAFQGMARLAKEVYREPALAAEWELIASKIREDLWTYCSGTGASGRQFFEGATDSGTFITGHDGEESDTTLMPFYGFCAADEPALTNHARLAMTGMNPFYSKELDAIWWYNDGWRSTTFPGWITALAGVRNEAELAARLGRVRQLTDLDGSIWWWPYKYGSKDPRGVRRANGAAKCGWASALYLCRFVYDVLGCTIDFPARQVEFRPFVPWNSFEWRNCRIGSGVFDFRYERNDRGTVASVVNQSGKPFTALVELVAPEGRDIARYLINGAVATDGEAAQRYGRSSMRVRRLLETGGHLSLEIRYVQ